MSLCVEITGSENMSESKKLFVLNFLFCFDLRMKNKHIYPDIYYSEMETIL